MPTDAQKQQMGDEQEQVPQRVSRIKQRIPQRRPRAGFRSARLGVFALA